MKLWSPLVREATVSGATTSGNAGPVEVPMGGMLRRPQLVTPVQAAQIGWQPLVPKQKDPKVEAERKRYGGLL